MVELDHLVLAYDSDPCGKNVVGLRSHLLSRIALDIDFISQSRIWENGFSHAGPKG